MNMYGDILPFLQANPDLSPATCQKLSKILEDSDKAK